jgi:transposase-like protein
MAGKKHLSQQKIDSILHALVANGLNYVRTAREEKVNRTSLIRWAREAGIAGGSTIPKGTKSRIGEKKNLTKRTKQLATREGTIEERTIQFENDVMDIKEMAAQQIKAVIPITFDIERIARSIKFLDEIVKADPELPKGGNNTVNFIQLITEQLKFMDHEPTED